jgi:archaellum component FlaC
LFPPRELRDEVMAEPENVILHLLREMRERFDRLDAKVDELKSQTQGLSGKVDDLDSALHSLRADVASDLMTIEKRTSEQIVGLRRAVVEYHSSVVGHGLLIGDLDERVRRLETAPSGAH